MVNNNEEKEIFEAQGDNHFSSNSDTPLLSNAFNLSDEEKIALIEKDMFKIMTTLGLDLSDDSLKGTPHRVAKMFVKEIFGGLHPNRKPKSSNFDTEFKNQVKPLLSRFFRST